MPGLPLTIEGTCAPGYEHVRDAFAASFARDDDYRECGAAVAAYRRGRPVVDLWGGFADRARTRPWRRDTLVNVWSTTKGAVAAALALLVEDGALDYADPIVRHWPELGAAGKGGTTIAHVLSHQAGLPGFREPTRIADLYDWKRSCTALARQVPAWEPGTNTSYHAMTFGYLAGEIVRRVTGKTVGRFLAERIATPLGADFFIGLPATEEPRVAETIAPKSPPNLALLQIPEAAMMALVNPQLEPEAPNARGWRAAEIPAANGHASAQGVARLYAALANGGELDGARLWSSATIARMATAQSARRDMMLGFTGNWALGVTLNVGGVYGPDPLAFGHSGWGGSFGCASPATGVAVGYVCNQMGSELVGDPRGAGLCNAVFAGG